MKYIVLTIDPFFRRTPNESTRVAFGVYAKTNSGETQPKPFCYCTTREDAEIIVDSLNSTQPLLDPEKAKSVI